MVVVPSLHGQVPIMWWTWVAKGVRVAWIAWEKGLHAGGFRARRPSCWELVSLGCVGLFGLVVVVPCRMGLGY